MKTSSIKKLAVSMIFVAGTLLAAQASAASACKGLESNACSSNTQCSWVGAYERKDGRQVKGFCRIKSKSSASKAKTASKDVAKSN